MDTSAVYNLKRKFLSDFNVFKKGLNKGYQKDYDLLMRELCVIENSDYFDDDIYEYLISTTYE